MCSGSVGGHAVSPLCHTQTLVWSANTLQNADMRKKEMVFFCIVHGISQKITLWKCLNLIVNFMFIFKQESAVIENWALSQFWVTPHKCPNKDTMHSVDDHYESWSNSIHPAKHWQDNNTKHSSKQLILWCSCLHLNICHIYEVSSQKNQKNLTRNTCH